MKTTLTLTYDNNEAIVRTIEGNVHSTTMWIGCFSRQVAYTDGTDKLRIDINCAFGDTHIEITYTDKWIMTYVEDEFFCDTAIEFDTKGEMLRFIKDILTNLKQADEAEREWGLW